MLYLQQPKQSKLCGQTCLAMITGKPVEDIIELIGTKKGTSTKRILNSLSILGFNHSGRLIPRRTQPLPSLAICKIRREWNKSGNWHWVVLCNGMIYDPDPVTLDKTYNITSVEDYDAMCQKRRTKFTSYITIYDNK